jgi:penicillin-binding protein 1A
MDLRSSPSPDPASPQTHSSMAFPGKPRGRKRLLTIIVIVLFLVSAAFGGLFWLVRNLYQTLPTPDQLANIEPSLVTKVLGNDGTVIHEFSQERRFWVPIDSMPAQLVNAVVAIEDRRFYQHWGADLRRIVGAMLIDVLHGGYKQGASTITQQLARNVYLTSKQSMIRKIREALTAIQLESYYTKREILELYLNQVYLGAGVYGVQAACQRYFGKSVSQLSLNECAVIAGTIQLPEYYRPDKPANLKRALGRRGAVLNAMRGLGYLDRRAIEAVSSDSIPVSVPKTSARIGPYFVETVRQYALNRFGDDVLYNGGLTIRTTLDPAAQVAAEKAVDSQLVDLQSRCNRIFLDMSRANLKLKISKEFYASHFDSIYAAHKSEYEGLPDSAKLRIAQVALVAMDARTGEIRAMVGGRDFEESKFNRATQAYRQPGSAFKPIVYTTAIEHGFTSVTEVLDQPITLETPEGQWRPENYDGKFYGRVTIRRALALSINLPAIQTLLQVGADTVVQYARKLGLTTPISAVPSIAMGSCEVIPQELVTAYGVFANGGFLVKPYVVSQVLDKNGRLVEELKPHVKHVLAAKTAFIMADMLGDVVCCGTGAAIPGMGFTRPAGGKTGTTNRYSDAWFIGFTPQIVCGVWVGLDEQRTLGAGVTGAQAAIPIWVKTMVALHRDLPTETFVRPDSVVTEDICNESNKIATRYCPQTRPRFFIEGTMTDSCDVHGPGVARESRDFHNMFGSQRKPPSTKHKTTPRMF